MRFVQLNLITVYFIIFDWIYQPNWYRQATPRERIILNRRKRQTRRSSPLLESITDERLVPGAHQSDAI